MNPIFTIVVPTDFGSAAARALDHAVELAERFGAEVVLLHAIDSEPGSDRSRDAQSRLEEEVLAAKRGAVAVRALVRHGDPWQIILATAEELGAGMIVMGSELRDGTPRRADGALAEKIVRTALVPVLVVPVCEQPRSSMELDFGERTVRTA